MKHPCRVAGTRRFTQTILLVLASSFVNAAEDNGIEDPPTQQEKAVGQNAIDDIRELFTGLSFPSFADESIKYIEAIIDGTREAQDTVYDFSRVVNNNIQQVPDADGGKDFKDRIRGMTNSLRESTYDDSMFQNGNLSRLIRTRLPRLIEDSVRIGKEPANTSFQDDFERELKKFTTTFLSTNRFRPGFGISYSYIPDIFYQNSTSIDFTPLLPSSNQGPDRLTFDNVFSNKSYLAFALSAKIPFATIEASFPNYDEERTFTTPVRFRNIGEESREMLYRTTVQSTLEIDYDINVKFSFKEFANSFPRVGDSIISPSDVGVGAGFLGIQVTDNIATDIRFRTDSASTFDSLSTSSRLENVNHRSFTMPYFLVYSSFDIGDQMKVGISLRYATDASKQSADVDLNEYSIAFNFMLYPTAKFINDLASLMD